MTKIEAYKVSAQYCAFVHLGYIPRHIDGGLCINLQTFLHDRGFAKEHFYEVSYDLHALFNLLGLDEEFPVEGDWKAYRYNLDKYHGAYGTIRRKLAAQIAVELQRIGAYRCF